MRPWSEASKSKQMHKRLQPSLPNNMLKTTRFNKRIALMIKLSTM